MKKNITFLIVVLLFSSCKKEINYQQDELTLEINDFIWKAMNNYYLWKNEKTILADDYFKNQEELNNFLDNYSNPENLFEDLIYDRTNIDHWSWIVDDYEKLLQYFQGIRKTTGMRIGLVYEPGSSYYIYAYVRYVIPNSDAWQKGITRGNIFRKINGERLNIDNYNELLRNDNLNIELAQWTGNNLTDTGTVINLTKTEISENPIYISNIIQQNGKKIGYLMYNGFTQTYNSELNSVMNYFSGQNIDELIIDLRYNPGGSVSTMQYLASMITGQFTGSVFLKYQWHPQLQEWMLEQYPNSLHRSFVSYMNTGETINHLYLNKVYVITTKSSASASESLINCLKPYIQVIQFGTETSGKYTASVTLFDSSDFSYNHINPRHKWALQPIVLKISNALNQSDFVNGILPDYYQAEDYQNLGILGDTNEPLLNTVLQYIDGNIIFLNRNSNNKYSEEIQYVEEKYMENQYIDELPSP